MSVRSKRFLIVFLSNALVLLCWSFCNGQTKKEFISVTHEHLKNSPSGGLTANSDAVVFVLYRKSNKLAWLVQEGADKSALQTVPTTPPVETDETKENGPTPLGEYLIGKKYKHAKHKIDWYKLYPRKENNSGYYSYTKPTQKGRVGMGLHPGRVSLGCVTVTSTDSPYDKATDWQIVKSHLDAANLKYKNDEFSGYLIVVDK